jgi:hypothetical protein
MEQLDLVDELCVCVIDPKVQLTDVKEDAYSPAVKPSRRRENRESIQQPPFTNASQYIEFSMLRRKGRDNEFVGAEEVQELTFLHDQNRQLIKLVAS